MDANALLANACTGRANFGVPRDLSQILFPKLRSVQEGFENACARTMLCVQQDALCRERLAHDISLLNYKGGFFWLLATACSILQLSMSMIALALLYVSRLFFENIDNVTRFAEHAVLQAVTLLLVLCAWVVAYELTRPLRACNVNTVTTRAGEIVIFVAKYIAIGLVLSKVSHATLAVIAITVLCEIVALLYAMAKHGSAATRVLMLETLVFVNLIFEIQDEVYVVCGSYNAEHILFVCHNCTYDYRARARNARLAQAIAQLQVEPENDGVQVQMNDYAC